MSRAPRFIDLRTEPPRGNELWPVAIMRGEAIAAELERLSEDEPGEDGRRESLVVHPDSGGAARGLTPGTDVTFGVLLPGESTRPRRRNAVEFAIALAGNGRVEIGETTHEVGLRDAWTVPSMKPVTLVNPGDEPFHYLASHVPRRPTRTKHP